MSLKDEGTNPTVIKKPLDWSGLNLSEAVKSVRFFKDKEGSIWGFPVFLIDPRSPGDTLGSAGSVLIRDPTNTANIANVIAGLTDFAPLDSVLVLSQNYVYQNVLGVWEKQRTPTIWKTAQSTNTFNFWDPAAGKKVRLMGFHIQFAGVAMAAATLNHIHILDNAAEVAFFDFWCPLAASATKTENITVILPGNGYLSVAADNIFSVSFNAAVTQGEVSITAWGTEE
jgi:hypothetical protein